jgi:hypothetical protein
MCWRAGPSLGRRSAPTGRTPERRGLKRLEGRGGKDFDASAGDPCEGKGALNDLGDAPKERATLDQALKLATVGIREKAYEKAHKSARAAHALLAQAEKARE